MSPKRLILVLLVTHAIASSALFGQFAATGTTTLSVAVNAEAVLRVDTAMSTLSLSGDPFSDYNSSTGFTYKIRTGQSSGTGNITLQVTTDFSPTGGPSVASSGTTGDTLKYTCSVTSPGTACSGSQTTVWGSATPVASFSNNAKSAKNGNTGSVSWALVNDPQYSTGSYTATVTFTVSST